jgi:S-DNA-T family DNA segregation ATPase FtsK/SpoIIIE
MEHPSLKRVCGGAALVLVTLLMLFSVLSYSPHDPPNLQEYPPSENIQNWCGIVGATIASTLFTYVGEYTSLLLVLLGLLWVGLFFSNRTIRQPWMRLGGVAFSIVTVSAFFAWYYQKGGRVGTYPGVIGDASVGFLVGYLSYAGSLILIVTVGALALLLATDMLLWGAGAWVAVRLWGWIVGALRGFFGITRPEGAEAGASDAPLAKPKRQKKPAESGKDAKAEEEEAGEEEPEEEVEERRASVDLPDENGEEPQFIKAETLEKPGERKNVDIPEIEEDTESGEQEYVLPGVDLLDERIEVDPTRHNHVIQEKARVLERCLKEFGIAVRVVGIDTGPVVTLYELELAPGIKVGRIIGLSDDIAMALKAPNVRIVAPIPGKSTVGVEVPNLDKEFVQLVEIMHQSESAESRHAIPLFLGKDAAGAPLTCDMTSLPHLLIAGETGSGKSVCINSVILSVLMTRSPHDVRFLLVDPKMVELTGFKELPHLLCPVVTDMKKAASILEWAESKMDERYEFLSMVNVRNIAGYNSLSEQDIRERYGLEPDEEIDPKHVPLHLPYIIIIIDELADLMLVAPKEIETSITRLAQKSRAVGIHIILATQRPSVDVITGLIKSNLPARISFRVASKVDSRTILDQNGADKLLGSGDMLFLQPGTSKLIRAQGTYVSDDEIHRVVEFAKAQQRPDFSKELVQMQEGGGEFEGSKDPLYEQAVRIVMENQRGSVSLLQRKLEIGYSRAARLIDFMAEEGLVGSYKGSQAREVLLTLEEWEERLASQGES